jgi:hypothetical protein
VLFPYQTIRHWFSPELSSTEIRLSVLGGIDVRQCELATLPMIA